VAYTVRRMLCIVRAHNEERAIAGVVSGLLSNPAVDRVVVVCAACDDLTEPRARSAGADTVTCDKGLGRTTKAAFKVAGGAPFVLVDGDMPKINHQAVVELSEVALSGRCGRGGFDRPGRSSIRIAAIAAELGVVLPPVSPQALSTAYTSWPAAFAEAVDWSLVGDERGSDLALALAAHDAGFDLVEVSLGPRVNDSRGEEHIESLVAGNHRTLELFAAFRSATPSA
jgi:hypothetical protein